MPILEKRSTNTFTFLIRLGLLIGWALVIFWFSSQPYSKQDIKPLLSSQLQLPEAFVTALAKIHFTYADSPISVDALGINGMIEFFIRKGAHLSAFFILSVLIYRFLAQWVTQKAPLALATTILVFLYACSDEWHQSFTGERTPLFTDVLIDTTGGLLAVMLILLVSWMKRFRNTSR